MGENRQKIVCSRRVWKEKRVIGKDSKDDSEEFEQDIEPDAKWITEEQQDTDSPFENSYKFYNSEGQ